MNDTALQSNEEETHDPSSGLLVLRSFKSMYNGSCVLNGCVIKKRDLVYLVQPAGARYPLEGVACDGCACSLPRARGYKNKSA